MKLIQIIYPLVVVLFILSARIACDEILYSVNYDPSARSISKERLAEFKSKVDYYKDMPLDTLYDLFQNNLKNLES